MNDNGSGPTVQTKREVRLDFFRGLALVFIFLDHVPSNVMNWLTVRNFGFSDASEAFVFIAGYSAVMAYGRRLESDGFAFVLARVYKRCWQLYVAQMLLFMVFTAQVAYTAATFNNPMYSEEMGLARFFAEPHVTLFEAMSLRFRPTNMDILPLYIVLLAWFPVILVALKHHPRITLVASFLGWVIANLFGFNLTTWPEGVWLFNPLGWQFLFVLGAGAALFRPTIGRGRRLLLALAAGYLAFSFIIVLTWHLPGLEVYLPRPLQWLLYPIDKTALSPWRLLHFAALAHLVLSFLPGDSPVLGWRIWRPLVGMGEHALEIFCLGVFLSFAAHIALVEWNDSLAAQAMVSCLGVLTMALAAAYLSWYRRMERRDALRRAGRNPEGRG